MCGEFDFVLLFGFELVLEEMIYLCYDYYGLVDDGDYDYYYDDFDLVVVLGDVGMCEVIIVVL